jgi:glucose/arabinose dehydrogenase
MQQPFLLPIALTILLAPLAGCAEAPPAPTGAAPIGFGAQPALPAPQAKQLIPTVNIAPAKGWPANATPVAAPGLAVHAYASALNHPRMLHVMPNGDILVAESNAPAQHDAGGGIRGWIMKKVMGVAGAGVTSPDRIMLLRDTNGDGVADLRSVLIKGLHSPFGMAVVGNELFVADTDALLRFPYQAGQTEITVAGTRVLELPAGPIDHHWTKDLVASADGKKLYVSIGSNSNVGENGMAAEEGRAAIWEFDRATGTSRIFASGLRNPNGLTIEPQSGALWTAVNERDELGNNLVPDYITSVKDGAFYGWPYSYYGQHVDTRITPPRPDLVAKAIAPDYAVGAHTASLGLTFNQGKLLPETYAGGAFIGQHGSWNRKPRSGYKVIFVPFSGGKPSGLPSDVLTGFLNAEGDAQGRPVGVAIDSKGALLVADDVGNTVWRVTPAAVSVAAK